MAKSKKKHTGLVLQGGGALGAFEYGALTRLYEEEDFSPSAISGVSIGAITTAVITGTRNPRENLDKLWDRLTVPGAAFMSSFGNPGMYTINPSLFLFPLTMTSYYDTQLLYSTLGDLVDLDILNNSDIEVVLTSSNIREGTLDWFSNKADPDDDRYKNKDGKIRYEHVVASGSLPPGFPITHVDSTPYWDGGLLSNTPFEPTIKALEGMHNEEVDLEMIIFDLFPKKMEADVSNMQMVNSRMIELIFSNHFSQDAKQFDKIRSVQNLVVFMNEQLQKLPADEKKKTEKIIREEHGEIFDKVLSYKPINKVCVNYDSPETSSAGSNFSPEALNHRKETGYKLVDEMLTNGTLAF
ncbi:MAG: patatin-like phospholipase family protein [Desulfobacterium sp.]|nr:patatin-like phospholipase family protein [Desulfobacterium sp.]